MELPEEKRTNIRCYRAQFGSTKASLHDLHGLHEYMLIAKVEVTTEAKLSIQVDAHQVGQAGRR